MGDSRASVTMENRAIDRRIETPAITATTTTTAITAKAAASVVARKFSTEVFSSTLPIKPVKAR